jgi:hypothetical protein
MDASQPGSEQKETESGYSEPDAQGDGGPGEEECGRRIVVALIG